MTGVQTCALPIYAGRSHHAVIAGDRIGFAHRLGDAGKAVAVSLRHPVDGGEHRQPGGAAMGDRLVKRLQDNAGLTFTVE